MTALDWQTLTVAEDLPEETPCECCGQTTILLQGEVFYDNTWVATYVVRWTKGHADMDPEYTLLLGDWSDEAAPPDRWVMRANQSKENGSFYICNARDDAADPSAATYLNRDDILGTPTADECFAYIDAILMKHSQLKEWRI